MIDRWRRERKEAQTYAATLGVGRQDLQDLHVCWAPDTRLLPFPMCDPNGNIVGFVSVMMSINGPFGEDTRDSSSRLLQSNAFLYLLHGGRGFHRYCSRTRIRVFTIGKPIILWETNGG